MQVDVKSVSYVPAERNERIADVVALHTIVHTAVVVGRAHVVESHVMNPRITRKSLPLTAQFP